MSFFNHAEKTVVGTIEVRDIPAYAPEFQRVYKDTIDREIVIKLTVRFSSIMNSRTWDGEATQPGGRYIYFDPQRVAEKIIDPVLVPQIEALCRRIFDIDREFWSAKPSSFVDDKGQRWTRV